MKKASEEEICLALNSYDEIFTGFDPRPYSQRALSVDFIGECKRASADKTSPELILEFPKSKRNKKHEPDIKKRLSEHFQKHFKEKRNTIKKIKREGVIWIIAGIIVIALSLAIGEMRELVFNVSFVIGWFLIWEGSAKIFITAKEKLPEYEFYKKMSSTKIEFINRK